MGRYFDDFKVGDVYRHWPGRTIREADNTWFTLLTMNTHPIHFDDAYAADSQHGRCLVNGTLVFSVVVGMSVSDVSERCIANLDYEAVKHLGPVFAGDTLYADERGAGGAGVAEQAGPGHRARRDPRLESGRRAGHVLQAAPPRTEEARGAAGRSRATP